MHTTRSELCEKRFALAYTRTDSLCRQVDLIFRIAFEIYFLYIAPHCIVLQSADENAQTETDITVESGQYDPETLLDLAITFLAGVTDRQPNLNKASLLLKKVCPLVSKARVRNKERHSQARRSWTMCWKLLFTERSIVRRTIRSELATRERYCP